MGFGVSMTTMGVFEGHMVPQPTKCCKVQVNIFLLTSAPPDLLLPHQATMAMEFVPAGKGHVKVFGALLLHLTVESGCCNMLRQGLPCLQGAADGSQGSTRGAIFENNC